MHLKFKKLFRRYEIKYIIKKSQYDDLLKLMLKYMQADDFGQSTICNIYFDTPDNLLIRRSIEHPIYKEKLRVRSYGKVEDDTTVFVELKKKYDGVVYKRRVDMPYKMAREYLCEGKLNMPKTQITNEIDYVLKFYKNLNPSMYISYEREAFFSKTDSDFRMTFDRNILYRDYDLTLKSDVYGKSILPPDEMILEVKTSQAIPLWLTEFLTHNKIYKASFSKYGNAYKNTLVKGDLMNVG